MSSSLFTHLPVLLKVPRRPVVWRLKENTVKDEVLDITRWIENSTLIPPNKLYKQGVRRLIFQHSFGAQQVLVKAFPLKLLRHRLKYKRYAWNEGNNLLRAQAHHLPVPEVVGYGVAKWWGLVKWCAVLMEHLNCLTLGQCLRQHVDEVLQWQYLLRVLPLFKKIYESGCNHLDFKPDSILLREEEARDFIIDFQYVVYSEKPNPNILVMQAAHFAWEVSVKHGWVSEQLLVAWFEILLEYLDLTQDPKLWQIFQKARCQRTTVEERLCRNII